jgi:hypothetical protein
VRPLILKRARASALGYVLLAALIVLAAVISMQIFEWLYSVANEIPFR